MASDYLLEIEGVKGESQDEKHPGSIEVESFSWGATNPGSVAAGTAGAKVSFQDLHFTSKSSKATPSLFLACASGMHIKKATLFVRKSGGDTSLEYYKVTLTDILVTSVRAKGDTEPSRDDVNFDTVPTDQFSLNFGKIEFAVYGQTPNGTLDEGVKVGWNLKKQTAV